jgi:hypothetical protein
MRSRNGGRCILELRASSLGMTCCTSRISIRLSDSLGRWNILRSVLSVAWARPSWQRGHKALIGPSVNKLLLGWQADSGSSDFSWALVDICDRGGWKVKPNTFVPVRRGFALWCPHHTRESRQLIEDDFGSHVVIRSAGIISAISRARVLRDRGACRSPIRADETANLSHRAPGDNKQREAM